MIIGVGVCSALAARSSRRTIGYRRIVNRLAVRVLGPFAVEGLDERGIGSRKARTLLKLLACERGEPVSVDRIADAIWGDALPAKPADQVSVLVSRLRGVLGGRIIRTDAGYALDYDWLDLDELITRSREAVARLEAGRCGAARAAASAALRLVGERALVDEDAAWADDVRTRIDRVVAEARHAGGEASLSVGAASEAVALGSDALDHDPYDEVALQLVMRALSRLGRPGSALALYGEFKERLVDAFGIGPTAATEAVHDQVVLGEAMLEVDATVGVDEASGLVGRDVELSELDARLVATRAASSVVIIQGEPGIGKTALADAWAHRVSRSGVHVLFARCDQLAMALPLQPVLDAVRAWLVQTLGTAGARERIADDPELRALLGFDLPVDRASTARSTTVESSDVGRRRLYANLVSLIRLVQGASQLVVVVDDLDQADPATLSWLGFLVRSEGRVLVVGTARGEISLVVPSWTLVLGPLDLDAVARLLHDIDVASLYARSGGNPLFLRELAQVAGGELPRTVVEAVSRRVTALGSAASTLRVAALLGAEIDLDLLAACCRRPVAEVLDHIDAAVRSDLLVDAATGLRFRHDVVREALVAGTTGSVRAFVHREASLLLANRSDHHPLDTAHHAERGGASEIASNAFVEGAAIAAERFETDLAEELLNRAIELVDTPRARMARARVHLTQRSLDAAATDVDAALASERSSTALELAGWIAYYRREYAEALLLAAEARSAAVTAPELRASAAVLEGRIRHARGDLDGAVGCLEPAAMSPDASDVRSVARVWLAAVRAHQGRVTEALVSLDSAGDPGGLRSHPFATAHAWFVRCLATGVAGELVRAFDAVDGLEQYADRSGVGGARFHPFAYNMRGWLERSVGNLDDAEHYSAMALDAAGHAAFDEPAMHARLDLVETRLIRGRDDDASDLLRDAVEHLEPTSTMGWHIQQRVAWLKGRLALAAGDCEGAAEQAQALVADATARGSQRYGVLGRHLGLVARSRSAGAAPGVQFDVLLADIARLAALDAWRLMAELAAHEQSDALWIAADAHAAALVAQTRTIAHLDSAAVGTWIRSTLDAMRG